MCVGDISSLLSYYTAYSGNSSPTFRDDLSFQSWPIVQDFFLDFLTLENGIERLSRNVGKELPVHAAL